MLSAEYVKKRLHTHHLEIRPGGVASVGDTLMAMRLKRSMPEQAPLNIFNNNWGSNVVDGNNQAMHKVGAGARVFQRAIFNDSGVVKDGVEIKQDLRAVDRKVIPLMGTTESSWQHSKASVFSAVTPQFSQMPKAFSLRPGQQPRGQMPVTYQIGQQTGSKQTQSIGTDVPQFAPQQIVSKQTQTPAVKFKSLAV